MKTTAEMLREFFAAPADVKEFMAEKYDGVLSVEVNNTPKKPRRLFNNDFAKMAKVERNLNDLLNHFSNFLADLYVYTDGENFAHVDTHGKFINLWDLCVEEGDGAFEFVTNWIRPNELYEIDDVTFKIPDFIPAFDAFSKIHFLENRREELLEKRDRLMEEYGDDYCYCAGLFTSGTKINPKTKKSA